MLCATLESLSCKRRDGRCEFGDEGQKSSNYTVLRALLTGKGLKGSRVDSREMSDAQVIFYEG